MLRAMEDCLACGLASGRLPLPGGLIHGAGGWLGVRASSVARQLADGEHPDDGQVEVVAGRARALFGGGEPPGKLRREPGRRVGTRRPELGPLARDLVARGHEVPGIDWTYSLEDYAVALEEAGMVIEALREPRPSGVEDRYQRWSRRPTFLMFRATKR